MTAATTPQPGTGSLRSNSAFRTFWAGHLVSQFGDRISELALPLIAVTLLGATTAQVSVLSALVWAPYALALVIGAWVDRRTSKRAVLVAADLGRAVVVLSIPAAYLLDVLTLVQVFAVAALVGLGSVFFNTGYPPVFVSLVERASFADANGKVATVRSVSYLIGPAVGGGLIAVLTAPVALVVDTVSYLVSAMLLRRIPLSENPIEAKIATGAHSVLRSAGDGMRFVVRHRFLRASLACATTLNLFMMAANALVIVYASRELGLSAAVIGLALGAGAVGGVLTAVVAARVGRAIGIGRTIVIGAVVSGAACALLPLAAGGGTLRAMVALGGMEFVAGVGIMLFDVNLNAVQAAVTPDAVRSRVSGAFSTVNYGIRPVGALLGGLGGTLIGIAPTLVVAAAGGACSAVWLLWSPIRRLEVMGELDSVDPMTGLVASPTP